MAISRPAIENTKKIKDIFMQADIHWMAGTRLRSGSDFLTQLKEELMPLPQPTLFVSDPTPVHSDAVLSDLHTQIPEKLCFFRKARTPSSEEVRNTAEEWLRRGIASVVVTGGGSTIDFAKAVAHCMAYPSTFDQEPSSGLVFNTSWSPPHLPMIAVPTTMGTGSEVNGKSVVDFAGKRRLVFHWGMYPQSAIIHAPFFRGMPEEVLVGGALETMARLVVPVVSSESPVRVADSLAVAQVRALTEVVNRLLTDPGDEQARFDLAMITVTSVLTLHQLGRSQFSYWLWYLVNELNNFDLTKQQSLATLMPVWLELVRDGEIPGREGLSRMEAELSPTEHSAKTSPSGLTGTLLGMTSRLTPPPSTGLNARTLTDSTWRDWGQGLRQVNIGEHHVERVFSELLSPAT
ncbi:iron-containing alcohol dehydrogenase [Nocardiopsis alba]|uniref:iron-containing alcohol dehydrogenase n=1 Tax=Nocardiopsis alba TaxID=53437 RepID=UPI0033CA6118